MRKKRPLAGYLSQVDNVELRASYTGGDSEFNGFLNEFMRIISAYRLVDIGASQERIENLGRITQSATALRKALSCEPLWAELLLRRSQNENGPAKRNPNGPAELEELGRRYDTLIDELKLLEQRSRWAAKNGRERAIQRSSQKARVRADLWEPTIVLWKKHNQKLDYRETGLRQVIGIAHRILGLGEPTISSVNTVIRNLKAKKG